MNDSQALLVESLALQRRRFRRRSVGWMWWRLVVAPALLLGGAMGLAWILPQRPPDFPLQVGPLYLAVLLAAWLGGPPVAAGAALAVMLVRAVIYSLVADPFAWVRLAWFISQEILLVLVISLFAIRWQYKRRESRLPYRQSAIRRAGDRPGRYRGEP